MRGWWGLAWCLVVACRGSGGVGYDEPPLLEHGVAGEATFAPSRAPDSGNDGDAPALEMGGGGEPGLACEAEAVTLAEVRAGRVRQRASIALSGLVASSQKFLLSEAKSGSCLWAAFAAAAQPADSSSGLLLVSFGDPHAEGEACQSGSDGLPDDLAPGDLLSAQGVLDSYVPAACPEVAPALQLRIDAACPLQRDGSGAPPEPVVIDAALADRLALARDADLLREWDGALVRLESVSAQRDPDDGDAVFPFGVVQLAETKLSVSSRLYYFDLGSGGPRAAGKAPRYAFPAHFPHVTGILLLDYCTWVLAPRALQATGP